jgi:serine/threonine protein kinase
MTEDPERNAALDAIMRSFISRPTEAERERMLRENPQFAAELRAWFTAEEPCGEADGGGETVSFSPELRSETGPDRGTKLRYLGDYEILEEVGRGGMGIVYRARQTSLDRLVALKLILQGKLASQESVRRFRREAEAVAQLDHPNIVPIYEVGEYDGMQYFSMKLVQGNSLGQIGHLFASSRDAARLVAKVARAVDYAHRCGVVHRDLKPDNILIDSAQEPHVTDFGLARRFTGTGTLTLSTTIAGTPSFMAPEQATGATLITTAVDIYAIGAVLYYLLTGEAPFHAPTVLDTLRQVVEKEPGRPSDLRPGVDPDLEAIALRCLAKQPASRYRTAADLADDLQRFIEGKPTLARPITWPQRINRWTRAHRSKLAAAAAAGLVVVSAMIVVTGARNRTMTLLEGDRITSVLQESLAAHVSRGTLPIYWPSFEDELESYLSRTGDEAVDWLARRNVVVVHAGISPFGLAAEPPRLMTTFACNPAPSPTYAHATLEGSWDGGSWVPLNSGTCRSDAPGFGGFSGGADLVEAFGAEVIKAGPHRIALRTVVELYDLDSIGRSAVMQITRGREAIGSLAEHVAKSGATRPIFTETRTLGDLQINLYDEIPHSFPRRLASSAFDQESFSIRRLTLVTFRFPQNAAPCVDVEWRTSDDPRPSQQQFCKPDGVPVDTDLLMTVEMAGSFDLATPAPISGEARIRIGGLRDAETSFDIAIGGGRYFIGRKESFFYGSGWPGTSRVEGLVGWHSTAVPLAVPPGVYQSTLVVTPSREVALATSLIDRFIDGRLEFPVPVEVVAARNASPGY